MLQKNSVIELAVTALTSEGNGVGRYEGMAVFVPDTAIGDRIECKIVKMCIRDSIKGLPHALVSARTGEGVALLKEKLRCV